MPKTGANVAILLRRVATLAFRRRRTFIAGWLLLIVAVGGSYIAFGSTINSEFTIPGSSSQDARDELQKTLPTAAGTSAQIVFESPGGTRIADARYRGAVEATLERAKIAPQVARVVDPFTSKAISRDGRAALAEIQYTVSRPDLDSDSLPALVAATKSAQRAGLIVHAGGDAYNSTSSTRCSQEDQRRPSRSSQIGRAGPASAGSSLGWVGRHHQAAREDDRRHRSDPVEVDDPVEIHAGDAVVGVVGRLPEQRQGAETRGDEGRPGYPRGERHPSIVPVAGAAVVGLGESVRATPGAVRRLAKSRFRATTDLQRPALRGRRARDYPRRGRRKSPLAADDKRASGPDHFPRP
jgi:MMPL family